MATNNVKTFVSRAIRHHVDSGNLAIMPDTGRVALTATGRVWFATRLNDSAKANGPECIALFHRAMRDGAAKVNVNGIDYAMEPIDAKALKLPRTIKSYLAPQHCTAGSTISQACFSALFV